MPDRTNIDFKDVNFHRTDVTYRIAFWNPMEIWWEENGRSYKSSVPDALKNAFADFIVNEGYTSQKTLSDY